MIQTILIILILVLFLFTDFDEILLDLIYAVFGIIENIIFALFFIKRFIVALMLEFLYDILFEPIGILFGLIKKDSE